jgi:5-methyltetrahydropteroyltriglutamate--homocysteine methyltransferase
MLTQLYVDRGQHKPVDTEELARLGREATRTSIRNQAGAGIDIGNNGEQPRDSFVLYLRDRLSGLGGR